MRNFILLLVTTCLTNISGCTQDKASSDRQVGGPCEDCSLMFDGMPSRLSPETTIPGGDEPGEPITISGTIYQKDGKTPAPGIILYVYHTDHKGYYSRGPNQLNSMRHGHLRGWIKTDATGQYRITTVRPAPYPGGKDPAHIHPLIKEPGLSLYWIDEYLFDDDPLVTKEVRTSERRRGGPGIIKLTKNSKGVWEGRRDIILGLNIQNYQ